VGMVPFAAEERMSAATPRVARDPRTSEMTTGAMEAASRRGLLMIVRDYPPANTPATHRALGFARYLPEFGWDTSVVTVRMGFHSSSDSSLLRQVPEERSVYRAFGFDSKDVFSVCGRYPRLLAMPDRSVSWIPAGVIQALRAVREGRIDVLLSSGPPLTAHCIAHIVQRMTKLPWVADIRDLWDGPPPHARLSHSMESRLASRLLRCCDRVTVVTEEIAEGVSRSYGVDVAHKVHILPNGFDEDAFARLEPSEPSTERFTIAHVGWASWTYRNPRPFFEALRACLDRGALPKDTLVSFIGADTGTVVSLTRTFGLEGVIRVRERVPYLEALREMCSASALLLLQGGEFRHAVPAKTYEYLRSGRPIVALATPDGESARLLRQFAGVFMALSDQPAEVGECLEAAHRAWRDARAFERSTRQLAPYTRRSVAAELAEILDHTREPKTGDRRGRA
jgi:glycosyltransferase involved in cell wall biosynthesis